MLISRPRTRLAIAFVLSATLAGCSQTSEPAKPRLAPASRLATTDHALVDPCAGFDYTGWYLVMPAEQRARFAAGVAALQLGDSLGSVPKRLGEPKRQGDYQTTNYVPFGTKHRCWYMEYVVARMSNGLSHTTDQLVVLLFDYRGRLEIILSTVPGIATRETPDARSNAWRFSPWDN